MKNKLIRSREAGVELLRVVLMFTIVLIHGIIHGLKSQGSPVFTLIIVALSPSIINAYIFISGYYGIKFRWYNLFSLVFQALFYSWLIYIGARLFLPHEYVRSSDLWHAVFPVSSYLWWFMTVYITLYVLSPLLNKWVNNANKQQHKKIIAGILALNFSLFFLHVFKVVMLGQVLILSWAIHTVNFVSVYVLARYYGRYGLDCKRPFQKYLFMYIVSLVLVVLVSSHQEWGLTHLFSVSQSNPLLFFVCIFMFFMFKHLRLQSLTDKMYKWLCFVSTHAYAVYLFSDHYIMRELYHRLMSYLYGIHHNQSIYLYLLGVVLALFAIGISVDWLRSLLWKWIANPIRDRYLAQRKL